MVTTLVLFIMSLVRASQLENRRIAEGTYEKSQAASVAPWESFAFLTRYYGGVRTLLPMTQNIPEYPKAKDEEPYVVPSSPTPIPADKRGEDGTGDSAAGAVPSSKPFTDYARSTLPSTKNEINECFLDEQKTLQVPPIRYMDGRPQGFPDNVLGSYDLFSLPDDICFERYGRFGPYGFGYSTFSGGLGVGENGENEGSEAVWQNNRPVDWRGVDWADAQQRCYQANAARYKPTVAPRIPPMGFYVHEAPKNTTLQARSDEAAPAPDSPTSTSAAQADGDLARTAVVVRCWDEFLWREEDVMNLRGLISELSLASGGRYDIHLLVQVKDDGKNPVWADEDTYMSLIEEKIPKEFQGMVTLWSTTQMLAIYQGIHDLYTKGPDLPVHGPYRGLQMAMQYFAHKHPEYDYFWQWEMDIRYTGHYYDLFSKLENWAKAQPRKGLWERNARFYLPSVHGSWDDFKQMARVQSETGTMGAENVWQGMGVGGGGGAGGKAKDPHQIVKGEETIWGPKRPLDEADWLDPEDDPVPPTTYASDKYKWGVGEEADLITLNPIFNPDGTTWGLGEDITGYSEADGKGKPPRRAQIITASRMSRRLLVTMHRETAFKKHHAFPEMWPATVSLHHGYKAVFAPHPQFVDREWPVEYMAVVLNGGRNKASGGSRTSVFGSREHNMHGLTWFYDSGFAPNLYRRWLGLRVNNDGGDQFERTTDPSKNGTTVGQMRGGEGRMCLPPMLLHPVKEIDLPVEENLSALPIPPSDPAA